MEPEKKKPKIEQFPGHTPETAIPDVPEIPDPPVPNRAWTEMKLGRDIDDLSPEDKRDLYIGHDPLV